MDSNRIRRAELSAEQNGQIPPGAEDPSAMLEGVSAHDVAPVLDADTVEGQLGPDELSEPEEVAMNLEAKRHG